MHYVRMGNVTIEVIFWVKAFSVKPPTNLKTVCQIEIAVRFEYQNCKVPEIPCWAMLCKFEVTCVVGKRVRYIQILVVCTKKSGVVILIVSLKVLITFVVYDTLYQAVKV